MNAFEGRKSKSFDVVLDTVKLLITICTAILGFLASGILSGSGENNVLFSLQKHLGTAKWGLILLSSCIFFCILTILKITGTLGSERRISDGNVSIYDTATRILFGLSLFLFLGGVIVLGILSWNIMCGGVNSTPNLP